MANKLYKSLKDYRRCFTIGEEEQAKKEGYRDIREILDPKTGGMKVVTDMTPVPEFQKPQATVELHVESEDTTFQGESEKDLAHRFVNIYQGKKAYRAGKPTKLFKQYMDKHGM